MELVKILLRAARLLNAPFTQEGAQEMARHLRGLPRVGGRLLRRVRDLASVLAPSKEVKTSLAFLCLGGGNERGLTFKTNVIWAYWRSIIKGGADIETLAVALSEKKDTLEEVVEPCLLQQGFIQRTPRAHVNKLRLESGWTSVKARMFGCCISLFLYARTLRCL